MTTKTQGKDDTPKTEKKPAKRKKRETTYVVQLYRQLMAFGYQEAKEGDKPDGSPKPIGDPVDVWEDVTDPDTGKVITHVDMAAGDKWIRENGDNNRSYRVARITEAVTVKVEKKEVRIVE
jgi:hypothetical protein